MDTEQSLKDRIKELHKEWDLIFDKMDEYYLANRVEIEGEDGIEYIFSWYSDNNKDNHAQFTSKMNRIERDVSDIKNKLKSIPYKLSDEQKEVLDDAKRLNQAKRAAGL